MTDQNRQPEAGGAFPVLAPKKRFPGVGDLFAMLGIVLGMQVVAGVVLTVGFTLAGWVPGRLNPAQQGIFTALAYVLSMLPAYLAVIWYRRMRGGGGPLAVAAGGAGRSEDVTVAAGGTGRSGSCARAVGRGAGGVNLSAMVISSKFRKRLVQGYFLLYRDFVLPSTSSGRNNKKFTILCQSQQKTIYILCRSRGASPT